MGPAPQGAGLFVGFGAEWCVGAAFPRKGRCFFSKAPRRVSFYTLHYGAFFCACQATDLYPRVVIQEKEKSRLLKGKREVSYLMFYDQKLQSILIVSELQIIHHEKPIVILCLQSEHHRCHIVGKCVKSKGNNNIFKHY